MATLMRLFLFQALLFLFPALACCQNAALIRICRPDSNYTTPSPFKTNLDSLLTSLIASASRSSALFANASLGSASSAVYALAQCRPDASVPDCAACLNRSVATFASQCPSSRFAAVRFDLCLLRYSGTPFFTQLTPDSPGIIINGNNATDPKMFDKRLKDLMGEVSSAAPKSAARYAVGLKNVTDFTYIYAMLQCTRDLSSGDCALCLEEELGLFPTNGFGKIGAQVFRLSCTARFEMYPFFSLSILPRSPTPPLPSVSASPPGNGSITMETTGGRGKSNHTVTIVLATVIPVVAAILLFSAVCMYLRRKRPRRRAQTGGDEPEFVSSECLLFDLGTLRNATKDFSNANKLGEGGFGPVYKGVLSDGQEIAVKQLARTSGQGLVELRNEVALLAKLQHKNLVKLLGCCLERKEKLLVYEYLPNSSLDKFLFDPERRGQLDWASRYKIIEGIGRGLLYLHEDSRLKIVHRDLKASNILLDDDMNPKISDFGVAKLFLIDESQGKTSQIAGTYGYMAPEYAMRGEFSTKSDVYSYGVLVLEIVTGQKSNEFQGNEDAPDLLSYVWQHWTGGTTLQLRDQSLGDEVNAEEVLRCIQIGLLCVQDGPIERPSMKSVVLMLNSYMPLQAPGTPPAFFIRGNTTTDSDIPTSEVQENGYTRPSRLMSVNNVSVSELEPR